LLNPARLLRSPIVLKPSTLLYLHQVLAKRKYRMLFSPKHRRQPGPKGPNKELIDVVVELKRRNPRWGRPRIAQQIILAFGVEIDKDVVRRILSVHYSPFFFGSPTDTLHIFSRYENFDSLPVLNACPWRIANLGRNLRLFFLDNMLHANLLLFVHVVTVLIR
jgi:hypothetical protein